MRKRRPNGDGMIRKKDTGGWEGRIVIGHKDNGTPIFQYFTASTQKELVRKLHDNIQKYAGVDLREDCTMKLSKWIDIWLDEYAAASVRKTTLDSYQYYLNSYVKPTLGNKPVSKITKMDIQKLYRQLKEHGRQKEHPVYGYALSGKTIRSLHGVLHQVMETAVWERLSPNNPTVDVTLPPVEEKPKTILNSDQLDKFKAAIDKDKIWHDFFYMEITTGMRLGEICGLMWHDFDKDRGEIMIRRTVHRKDGGGLWTGDTKTSQGRRTIILPPSTAEMLQARQEHSNSKWIFHDPINPEKPIAPCKAYTKLKQILETEDLPNLRFHDLRHTFATHALTSGVDAKTLSNILGHTKAAFTLDTYTHVTLDMQKSSSAIVGEFISDIMVRR